MLTPFRVRALAARLADRDEVPAYVYDLAALDSHVAAIRAALPRGIELYYAVKANPDPHLLRVIARHADGLEVSSGGELAHVRAVAAGANVAFGGPGKTAGELLAAARAGVQRFHVESALELRLLAAAARTAGRTADVLLRVNLAGSSGQLVMGGPSPFGMDPGQLDACADLAVADGAVRLRGLHAHLASGLDASAMLAMAGRVLAFGRDWCDRRGIRAPEFNLGGGMAVDYRRPGQVFDWARYGRGLAALGSRPAQTLRIEPGRAVSAYCGWYVTRVLDVKRSHGSAFAVLNGGTHHLRTPAAKGHDQPFCVIPVAAWQADGLPRPEVRDCLVTLCGQLCTPKDVLARQVRVARLRAGDLVVFGLAGAYAWNISHQSFLMHAPPAFHYL